ncbi:MAG: chemotaxis protein CheW [Sulfurimonas sp.]|nr:chemotaxis protein CheW [Sulfurimonas sp.]MDQ7061100.1 chemotaxis protein CheW [Sulfurimonas sp.]
MQIEEILIIKNAHESYGISTQDISQIARVPLLMPLPLRPTGVRGLCAVSGNIVSMVDMNLLLGKDEVDYDADKTRIIILNDALASSSLLVSEVYNTVEIQEDKIEYIDKEDDPVIAIYKYKKSLIQVVSLEVLFSKISKVNIDSKEIQNGKISHEISKEEDTARYLIFAMANEQYALSIDYLREIILAEIEYTDIAGSSDEVLGLITIRDELLIVIDLRKHYGFKQKNGEKNRILIAYHKGKKIGLLVDEIIDIKNFALKDVEAMSEEFKDNKIAGIIHDLDNNLISYFDEVVLENLFKENESFIDTEGEILQSTFTSEAAMEVIVFKLSAKEYAFEVESVAEIIDVVDATSVAFTDALIDGIINIRGQIVAIVSLFEKLAIPAEVNEDSKIIICERDGIKIGFIVDSVSDILEIYEDEIREQEDALFSNILYLENGKRLVLAMDINEIVSNKEKI